MDYGENIGCQNSYSGVEKLINFVVYPFSVTTNYNVTTVLHHSTKLDYVIFFLMDPSEIEKLHLRVRFPHLASARMGTAASL